MKADEAAMEGSDCSAPVAWIILAAMDGGISTGGRQQATGQLIPLTTAVTDARYCFQGQGTSFTKDFVSCTPVVIAVSPASMLRERISSAC